MQWTKVDLYVVCPRLAHFLQSTDSSYSTLFLCFFLFFFQGLGVLTWCLLSSASVLACTHDTIHTSSQALTHDNLLPTNFLHYVVHPRNYLDQEHVYHFPQIGLLSTFERYCQLFENQKYCCQVFQTSIYFDHFQYTNMLQLQHSARDL